MRMHKFVRGEERSKLGRVRLTSRLLDVPAQQHLQVLRHTRSCRNVFKLHYGLQVQVLFGRAALQANNEAQAPAVKLHTVHVNSHHTIY